MVHDAEAERLVKLANKVVAQNKHWRLSVDDREDVTQELLEEALILEAAYVSDGMPGLIETAMRRRYNAWEYKARRRYRLESVGLPAGLDDDSVYEDVYFAGQGEDEHVSA